MTQPTQPTRPVRVSPKLKYAPRLREVYFCLFPNNGEIPEFWKRRPVVIVSKTNTLSGRFSALPFTTQPQPDNPWAYEMQSPIDDIKCWVICNNIVTFAVSRLEKPRKAAPKIPTEQFYDITDMMALNLASRL